jgi:hypothetical protein
MVWYLVATEKPRILTSNMLPQIVHAGRLIISVLTNTCLLVILGLPETEMFGGLL